MYFLTNPSEEPGADTLAGLHSLASTVQDHSETRAQRRFLYSAPEEEKRRGRGGRGREVADSTVKSVGPMDQKSKLAQLVVSDAPPKKEEAIAGPNTVPLQPEDPVRKTKKGRTMNVMLNGVNSIATNTTEEASTRSLEPPSRAPAVPEGTENRSHNAGRSQRVKPRQVGEEVRSKASLMKRVRVGAGAKTR